MRRLGIFIGYSPYQLDPYQGISRLMGFVIAGALKSGASVTIACPGWLRGDVQALLEDAGIDISQVEVVGTVGQPPLIRAWRFAKTRRSRTKTLRVGRLSRVRDSLLGVLEYWLASRTTLEMVGRLILGVVVALLLAIPVLILGLIGSLAFLSLKLEKRARRSSKLARPKAILRRVFDDISSRGIVDRIRSRELNAVISMINNRADIGVWYVPSMFWPEVAGIKGKIVMAAPDIVFYEHPGQFTSKYDVRAYERILESVGHADHLICYSDHVKSAHFVERNGIPADRITVIRHGFVDLRSAEAAASREEALDVLHRHIRKRKAELPEYLQGFRFDDVPFFFYSSQDRPHKNIEGLIKAYEKVLRESFRPAKLIATANLAANPRVSAFIADRGLQADVLSLKSVPNSVLAALYRLAALSVTPTLFEGGFPFTFSEAYSVGTPSIMSNIPVVREIVTDPELFDLMTFDPMDINSMAAKMVWGLDNRDALLAAQKPLYERLAARNWSVAAEEYLEVLRQTDTTAAV